MRYMTEQGRRDDTPPPGRPLWAAAERARVAAGTSKVDWTREIGIGRVTYDRLFDQENPPIARTVKKIADKIGIDYEHAMRLAGLGDNDDGVVVAQAGRVKVIQAKKFQRSLVEDQLNILRQVGAKSGRTLGDILVTTSLARKDELEVTDRKDEIVAVDDNNPIFTVEFLSTHRRDDA